MTRRIQKFAGRCESLEPRQCLSAVGFAAQEIECCGLSATRIAVVDLDGDQDGDLLSVASSRLEWRENVNGRGDFDAPQLIHERLDGATVVAVMASDLDGDQDLDVISAATRFRSQGTHINSLSWYPNLDGRGQFGEPRVITLNLNGVSDVVAQDLDGDGDQDLIASSRLDGEISWFPNLDGEGNFGERRLITRRASDVRAILTADMDGDSDSDVLYASFETGVLAWFENEDGRGAFSLEAEPRLITEERIGVRSLQVGDFDRDGDIDVLSAASTSSVDPVDALAWHENLDGRGSFGLPRVIASNFVGAHAAIPHDFDSDGDLDVLAASFSNHTMAWYENTNGQGDYGIERPIGTATERVFAIAVGDLNGDRMPDIATGEVAWYANLGRLGDFGPGRVVSSTTPYPQVISHGDLDQDGDGDVVVAFGQELAWYENGGEGAFEKPRRTLSTNHNRIVSIVIADLDRDGDADVVATGDDSLAWYENRDGRGDFGDARSVAEGIIELNDATVTAIDLDADGDIDLVVSKSFDDQTIGWYENIDGQGTFGPQRVIAQQNDVYETSIDVADIDGDGWLDIVSASSAKEQIVWYRGKGTGEFEDERAVTPEDHDARSVRASDIDGDGDLDILAASYSRRHIAWYENVGNGQFGVEHVVGSLAVDGTFILELAVDAVDFDQDGDADILLNSSRHDSTTNFSTDALIWYENAGAGAFQLPRMIRVQSQNGFGLSSTAVDVDGDGDVDILFASYSDGRLSWYENRLLGDVNQDGLFDSSDLVAVFQSGEYEDDVQRNSTFEEGDWNGDGEFNSSDLVFAFQCGHYQTL